MNEAEDNHLTFLEDEGNINTSLYTSLTKTTSLKPAIILSKKSANSYQGPAILSPNPRYHFAVLSNLVAQPHKSQGVHPDAVIGRRVKLGNNVHISPCAVIEDDVTIGDNTYIGPGCCILTGCVIGNRCNLAARVVVQHCTMGNQLIIHPGAVVGGDGFGYSHHEGKWEKMQHFGGVRLDDGVEIGANTTIDRAVFGNTHIQANVKIDNLAQIAHNVTLGEGTIVAGCVGIMGSTCIGKRCMIGGGAGINGHLKIVDDVVITGKTVIRADITKAGRYTSGTLAVTHANWKHFALTLLKVRDLVKKAHNVPKLPPGSIRKDKHF